jgi:hypothetical protein
MSPWKRSFALVALLFIGLTAPTHAQTLRGQVLDSLTAEPIRGMELVLIDTRGDTVAVARSNSEGRFAVDLRLGTYTIRCRCVGHRPKEATVEFDGDDFVTIHLAPVVIPP